MTKPQNCSARGYCDCLQKLDQLGYFDEGKTFLGLSLTDNQTKAFYQLQLLASGEETIEDLLTTAAGMLVDYWRTQRTQASE